MANLLVVGLMALLLLGGLVLLVGLFGDLFVTSVREAWADEAHRWPRLLSVAIAFGIVAGVVVLSFVY